MRITVGYPNWTVESKLKDIEAQDAQARYPEWFGLRSEIEFALQAVVPVMRSEPGDFASLPAFKEGDYAAPSPEVLESAPRYDYYRKYPSFAVPWFGERSIAQQVYVYARLSIVHYRVLIQFPYWAPGHPSRPYFHNGQRHSKRMSVFLEGKLARVETNHDRWLMKHIGVAYLGDTRF